MKTTRGDTVFLFITGACLGVVVALLMALLSLILLKGTPALSFGFLTEHPTSDMTSGGIWPAIFGTVVLTLLMTVAVTPVGIATAVWLNEYAPPSSRLAAATRLAVVNLAGVPSIVFGLFGLGFFVMFVGGGIDSAIGAEQPSWGKPSILWASMTLAVLTLPVVIVTTEEALKTVPETIREASLGLGATRFQTLVRVILPEARTGILTGLILAVSRGAGEVAPILFTGAANFLPRLKLERMRQVND